MNKKQKVILSLLQEIDEICRRNKIEYYLAHDEERKRIAENGCRKVSDKYSYANAWRYIFSVCNLKNEHIDMSNR